MKDETPEQMKARLAKEKLEAEKETREFRAKVKIEEDKHKARAAEREALDGSYRTNGAGSVDEVADQIDSDKKSRNSMLKGKSAAQASAVTHAAEKHHLAHKHHHHKSHV